MPDPEASSETAQRTRRWAAVPAGLAGGHRTADARLTTLYRLCPDGVVLTDARGAISGANPAFLRLTGMSDEAGLLGTDLVSLGVTGHDRMVLADALTGYPVPSPGRVVLVRPPGAAMPVRLAVTALSDGSADVPLLLFEDTAARGGAEPADAVDAVTGLPDPGLLGARLGAVLSAGSGRVALLYVDLDGFSVVTNGPGPEAGDLVLRHTTETLRAVFTAYDPFLTRLGGDRFAVLLHGGFAAEQVVALAERAIDRLSEPVYPAGGAGVGVGASVGVVVTATAGTSDGHLRRCAELALARAKELGRARCVLFDAVAGAAARDRYRRASGIAGALRDGQITVVYKPHAVLPDARIVTSLNATLRWDHPTFGRLRAPQFYPLAERTGMTVTLGRYLLAEALRTKADWRQRFGADTPVMCLTLPRRMAVDGDLVDIVDTELRRNGLLARDLMLCTEARSLLDERGEPLAAIGHLARLGVTFVLDVTGPTELEMIPALRVPAPAVMLTGPIVDVLDVEEPPEWARRNVGQLVERATELDVRVGAHGVRAQAHADLLYGLGVAVAAGSYLPQHDTAADAERWVGRVFPLD